MTTQYQRKPKSNVVPFAPTRRHAFCKHWSYVDGAAVQCGKPTKDGKHACPDCLKSEMRGSGYQMRMENVLGLRSGRRPG